MASILIRNTDKKARITLPKDFADQTVTIEQVDATELRIKKAKVIPEKELWLWQNPVAIGKVLEGLEQAKAGEFADGPDLTKELEALADVDENDTEGE